MVSEYAKPIMNEMSKLFNFIDKMGENFWIVRRYDDARHCSFGVTLSDGYIIMTGDYSGLMVRPCTSNLIEWMANATDLSYFAGKVNIAIQDHNIKEYSEEKAKKNIQEIKDKILDDYHGEEKESKSKEFDDLVAFETYYDEDSYFRLISKIESEFDVSDLFIDYDHRDYTHQIKLQHKCLVYWANTLIEKNRV